MNWLAKSAGLMALVAAIGVQAVQDTRAQDGNGSLRIQGDAAAVHLDVRKTTVRDVLATLAGTFDVSFRSATALDEVRDGTYQGSLRQVIGRVLDGYDYAIKQDSSTLDVIVFEKVGEQAVPAPQQHPVTSQRRRALASRDSGH
jgi:hypothetical protein